MLSDLILHLRNEVYISGNQNQGRLVSKALDEFSQEELGDPTKKFVDLECGGGEFLSEVVVRKLQGGISLENALKAVYGVDEEEDNITRCRERLLCGKEEYRGIVERNIISADALKTNYLTEGKAGVAKFLNDTPDLGKDSCYTS